MSNSSTEKAIEKKALIDYSGDAHTDTTMSMQKLLNESKGEPQPATKFDANVSMAFSSKLSESSRRNSHKRLMRTPQGLQLVMASKAVKNFGRKMVD